MQYSALLHRFSFIGQDQTITIISYLRYLLINILQLKQHTTNDKLHNGAIYLKYSIVIQWCNLRNKVLYQNTFKVGL